MSPRGLPHVGAFVEKRAFLSPCHHGNAVFLFYPLRLSPFTPNQRKNRPHMIASNVDKRRLDCPLFVFQAHKLTAFWCKHTVKKAPKNRFLTAIRHSFIKKLGQMSGATPPDGDKNIAANARLEYNTKARQSSAIGGLYANI